MENEMEGGRRSRFQGVLYRAQGTYCILDEGAIPQIMPGTGKMGAHVISSGQLGIFRILRCL